MSPLVRIACRSAWLGLALLPATRGAAAPAQPHAAAPLLAPAGGGAPPVAGSAESGPMPTVIVIHDQGSVRQAYAAEGVRRALEERGYSIRQEAGGFEVILGVDPAQLGPESFAIRRSAGVITISGGDERGVIYGGLTLAERLRNGMALEDCPALTAKPFLPFRGIKFDLPWDTYRHSHALSLHDETCRSADFWRAFLDMMAENRFNSLTLWNLHPYPYLVKPRHFPEASPWTDAEMREWQTLFHAILRMANERAIDTYIIPFNIFVTPEFARAHRVALDNLDHHHFVRGDTSEIIKTYTRECVTQMLEEYPELTGMGLTLGEGMGGMTPQEREDWMRETIVEGMLRANRMSKLVHRIPFSSTTGSLGVTSIETERLTRRAIEAEADLGCFDLPIWADLKFNWSHAHSTTKLVKVHGGRLYDTYFEPEPTKYKVTWTARNEDFFCLRWGVPSFVRRHIRENTHPYNGGYFIGSETYIPAKDYFTRDPATMTWRYAFERQWLFYKLWGRLLYDPATEDDVFRDEFRRRYGHEGADLLAASELAGRTPLRFASNFDLGWDFTLYSEGMMALDSATKRVEYVSVDRLIRQPPLDPDYVSVEDYVRALAAGGSFGAGRVTPPILAAMLERDCLEALDLVKDVDTSAGGALVYEVADIRAWSHLGLHLAEKIRGAVALQHFRTRREGRDAEAAIGHLERALGYWDKVVTITRPLYDDMPLVHLSEQDGKPWQENDHLRFHWALLRPDVARDVEIARGEQAAPASP